MEVKIISILDIGDMTHQRHFEKIKNGDDKQFKR